MKSCKIIQRIFSLIEEIEKKNNDSEIRKFYKEAKLDSEKRKLLVPKDFPNEDLRKFFNMRNKNEPF